MSRIAARRLLGQSPLTIFSERSATSESSARCLRAFSKTSKRRAEEDKPLASTPLAASPTASIPRPQHSMYRPVSDAASSPFSSKYGQRLPPGESNKALLNLSKQMVSSEQSSSIYPSAGPGGIQATQGSLYAHMQQDSFKEDTWQMHVYAHRHNVHITVTRPPAWKDPATGKVYGATPLPHRTPALNMSAGTLGFRKSGRKHFDTAFQLAAYALARMKDSGMIANIEHLEVYLRGFGQGREAVSRVLLGLEGKALRHKIVKVADSTRLKFGGTRSPKPRRLG